MTPAELLRTADALEEISSLHGYRHPEETGWSAHELRNEAQHLKDGEL